ncbi:unnamed protein product [Mytilus edulis]|uniref:Alpha-macroglobulin receptor-binding domain-containing protein n=1 Tax=Mytilus edulis TaxID=6550 RepID=A0A8S3VGC3_MYTED|nr:unnamed protein product [Mytilus edulis]
MYGEGALYEGKLYRIVYDEGKLYRIVYDESKLYRIVYDKGTLYRIVYVEGKLYRIVNDEGKLYRIVYDEGKLYRIVYDEGKLYRIVYDEGTLYRIVYDKGTLYRIVYVEGKLYRIVNDEGKLYRIVYGEGTLYEGKLYRIVYDEGKMYRTVYVEGKFVCHRIVYDEGKLTGLCMLKVNCTGLCMMKAVVSFNVNEQLRDPAFSLTTTILNDSTKGFTLKVCFRWLKVGQSTMGMLEITLPSGTEADLETMDTTNTGGQYKKVEKGFRSINLYFDTILSTQMCIAVDIKRVALVARHKAVPIKLWEVNEPSNEVIKTYESKALSGATIIEVCGPDNCVQVKLDRTKMDTLLLEPIVIM